MSWFVFREPIFFVRLVLTATPAASVAATNLTLIFIEFGLRVNTEQWRPNETMYLRIGSIIKWKIIATLFSLHIWYTYFDSFDNWIGGTYLEIEWRKKQKLIKLFKSGNGIVSFINKIMWKKCVTHECETRNRQSPIKFRLSIHLHTCSPGRANAVTVAKCSCQSLLIGMRQRNIIYRNEELFRHFSFAVISDSEWNTMANKRNKENVIDVSRLRLINWAQNVMNATAVLICRHCQRHGVRIGCFMAGQMHSIQFRKK